MLVSGLPILVGPCFVCLAIPFWMPIITNILTCHLHLGGIACVAIGVLLWILGVPNEVIVECFPHAEDARKERLTLPFHGISGQGGIDKYFGGAVDLAAIRGWLSQMQDLSWHNFAH